MRMRNAVAILILSAFACSCSTAETIDDFLRNEEVKIEDVDAIASALREAMVIGDLDSSKSISSYEEWVVVVREFIARLR